MPKIKRQKSKNTAGITQNRKSLAAIIMACILLVAALVVPKYLGSNSISLPSKYANLDNSVPSGIGPYYFNGVDPGEGVISLNRGQSVHLRVDSVFGQDIYIVLGDPPNNVILKTIQPKTENIDTTIVIPKDYKVDNKLGLVPIYVYYTIIDGEPKSNLVYVGIRH
jgi:hypothetical protein